MKQPLEYKLKIRQYTRWDDDPREIVAAKIVSNDPSRHSYGVWWYADDTDEAMGIALFTLVKEVIKEIKSES